MNPLASISNLGDYIGTFVLKFLTKEITPILLTLSLPDLTQFIHRVLKIFKTTLSDRQRNFVFNSESSYFSLEFDHNRAIIFKKNILFNNIII
jgi:hypothetical protein